MAIDPAQVVEVLHGDHGHTAAYRGDFKVDDDGNLWIHSADRALAVYAPGQWRSVTRRMQGQDA